MTNIFLKAWNQAKLAGYIVTHNRQMKVGSRLSVRRNFVVLLGNKATLKIGNHCFFNNTCSINAIDDIKIGDDCIFGENVKIYDHDHGYKLGEKFWKQPLTAKPVSIGSNCWFGSNVIILKGVHIGSNVVVGAGTIVAHDIADNQIVYASRDVISKTNNRFFR